MATLTTQFNAVGDYWGISSVNKTTSNDNHKIFFFTFTINNVTTVTYSATFDLSGTTYQDRYSNKINNVEQNYYLNISDMRSIVRDYPTITDTQLSRLFQRLINTCIEAMIIGITDLSGYILNANLDGSAPTPVSTPAFPA